MLKKQNNKNNFVGNIHENKELEQQKIILKEINKHLEEKIKKLELIESVKESEIHKINELEQQKILLNELNSMITKDDASIDEVLTILSHEFKTPMVPIKAYTAMLIDGHLGELTHDQKERLKVVQCSINSLQELVSNSIDSKKIELGQITMNKTETDLTKLVSNVIGEINTEVEKGNISYTPNEKIIISCDSRRISQVLVNLIKNCIKAIPNRGGKISIKTECVNNEAVVVVEDNGKGIPQEKLSTIFSRYGKTDRSETRDDAGIGLGLYLCKQITDAHGGRIWIESQKDVGTRVYFTLPMS